MSQVTDEASAIAFLAAVAIVLAYGVVWLREELTERAARQQQYDRAHAQEEVR